MRVPVLGVVLIASCLEHPMAPDQGPTPLRP